MSRITGFAKSTAENKNTDRALWPEICTKSPWCVFVCVLFTNIILFLSLNFLTTTTRHEQAHFIYVSLHNEKHQLGHYMYTAATHTSSPICRSPEFFLHAYMYIYILFVEIEH